MSWLVRVIASCSVLPMMMSVSAEEEAIAEPQPKVWNLRVLNDFRFGIYLQHQLERVAAGDGADFTDGIGLVENARILRVEEIVLDLVRIIPHRRLLAISRKIFRRNSSIWLADCRR